MYIRLTTNRGKQLCKYYDIINLWLLY